MPSRVPAGLRVFRHVPCLLSLNLEQREDMRPLLSDAGMEGPGQERRAHCAGQGGTTRNWPWLLQVEQHVPSGCSSWGTRSSAHLCGKIHGSSSQAEGQGCPPLQGLLRSSLLSVGPPDAVKSPQAACSAHGYPKQLGLWTNLASEVSISVLWS